MATPTGVSSSRRLAQKLEEVVAFRALAAGKRPQHPALFEFRWRHRADTGAVLVAMVQLARDLGLVSLADLAPDSTRVRANAGTRKAMNNGRMQQEETRLTAEIEALQRQAEALDTAQVRQFGMDLRGDELPSVLKPRESRRARREARAPEPMQLRGPREPHYAASQDGFQHCYNAQLVMDADSQLIVAVAVSPGQRPGPAPASGPGSDPDRCWPPMPRGRCRLRSGICVQSHSPADVPAAPVAGSPERGTPRCRCGQDRPGGWT